MSVLLYQFPISHYCEKVRWALDYKGIRYKAINLLPGMHMRRIRRLAGTTSVPVLVHDGRVIQGSSDILDYLDEAFPHKQLLPDEPELQARIRAWEQRLDNIAGPAVRLFCYHYLLQTPAVVVPLLAAGQPFYRRWVMRAVFPKAEQAMRHWMNINDRQATLAEQQLVDVLKDLRAAYSQSHFLVGEHFSRADLTACALFAPLFQPFRYPVPWPHPKRVAPHLRDWITEQDDLLEPLRLRYAHYR